MAEEVRPTLTRFLLVGVWVLAALLGLMSLLSLALALGVGQGGAGTIGAPGTCAIALDGEGPRPWGGWLRSLWHVVAGASFGMGYLVFMLSLALALTPPPAPPPRK